jgi:hypothetical protein
MAHEQLDSRLQLLQQQLLGFVALFQDTIDGVRAEIRGAEQLPALRQQQQEENSNPYDHLQAGAFQPRSLAGPWSNAGHVGGTGDVNTAALLAHAPRAPLQQQQQQDAPGQRAAPAAGQHQQQAATAAGHPAGSRLTATAAAATEGGEVLLETQLVGGDGTDTALLDTQVLDDAQTVVDQPAAAGAGAEAQTPTTAVKTTVEEAGATEQQQQHHTQQQHNSPVSLSKQPHGRVEPHPQQQSQQQLGQQHPKMQSGSQPELGATDSSDSRRMQQAPAASSSSGTSSIATSSSSSEQGLSDSEQGMQVDSAAADAGTPAAAAAAAAAAGDAGDEAGEVSVELAGDDDTHTGMLRMTYPGRVTSRPPDASSCSHSLRQTFDTPAHMLACRASAQSSQTRACDRGSSAPPGWLDVDLVLLGCMCRFGS